MQTRSSMQFFARPSVSRDCPLLIVGEFNAGHTLWGYLGDTRKGRHLAAAAQELGLTLINDTTTRTRIGSRGQVDTNPDLTFVVHSQDYAWTNTGETLGSDHCILHTEIYARGKRRRKHRFSVTNWDKFRESRRMRANEGSIANISSWTGQLLADVEEHTEHLDPEDAPETTNVDSRLLHMWQARSSMLRRWQQQGKDNQALKERITRLDAEISDHATEVTRQQWYQICDRMRGRLSAARTWHLLRHLLDPDTTRVEGRRNMAKLIHRHAQDPGTFLAEMRDKYIGPQLKTPLPAAYQGRPNAHIDEDITFAEVSAAAYKLRTNSAPGLDRVTNKILRDLDEAAIEQLTEFMNECWKTGAIPEEWKTSTIVFIPKPGKHLNADNLRPISLTSCVGKLMEHVVLDRLNEHVEDGDEFPHSMFGFRPHLSSQDVLLQVKRQVMQPESPADARRFRCLLGLDLKKAFDNVAHAAVLEGLTQLGVGNRAYQYVRNFLTDRKCRIKVGEHETEFIELGSRDLSTSKKLILHSS
ncbi:uncharacterized protein LOC142578332 [Dermacentor variabilis]|uniref:uncharacterized protein LOC142578332 n=1 Tax=Dermacentor variabilis TaxID=34621 RepID=UPI003F5B29C2